MKRYYIDSCVWLDYYEKRGKNSEEAYHFMQRILAKATILYSDLHIKELKKLGYSFYEIQIVLKNIPASFRRRVHIFDVQKKEAEKLAHERGISKGDALHAILARDNQAIMITRDKDFDRLKDIAEIKKPEDV